VNKHTDPAKPSGHANLFYPEIEPTSAEYDIAKRLVPKLGKIDPDLIWRGPYRPDENRGPQNQTMEIPDVRALDKPPVQFASLSGHTITDAEPVGIPIRASAGTLPLFNGLTALGKQTENEERAIKIAQANGLGGQVPTSQGAQHGQGTPPRPNFRPSNLPENPPTVAPKSWESRPKLMTGQSYNIPNGVDPDNWEQVKAFYGKYEGDIDKPYLDSNGNVTFGVGHMAGNYKDFANQDWISEQTGHKATPQELQVAWAALQAERAKGMVNGRYQGNRSAESFSNVTGLSLNLGASDDLLAQDYANAERQGLKIIPGPLPKEARHIVTDMVFNLGASKFSQAEFPNLFKELMTQQKGWLSRAAQEVHIKNIGPERNDYRRQVLEELDKAHKSATP